MNNLPGMIVGGGLASLAAAIGIHAIAGQSVPSPAKPLSPEICTAYHFDVAGPDGKVHRTSSAGMSGDGTGAIFFTLRFPDGLPDPGIVPASRPRSQFGGGSVLTLQTASRGDFRFEKAGDPQPIFMREAAVLRAGDSWFVGDRMTFDAQDRSIEFSVTADFIDIFQNTLTFEIWWKGQRRLSARIVPDKTTPEGFGPACLALPPAMRNNPNYSRRPGALLKIAPAPTPRLQEFLGAPNGPRYSNPFDVYDKTAGSASFTVTVGRDGQIKQCDLTAKTGKVGARPAACETARQWAEFSPATDGAGAPREAEASFTIAWSTVPSD
ncbi:hypothetical protein [Sphingomonas sp. KR3-1]|uniref:hypothetical protein n=1 Tax=Sphingomonas sp. KR3-1 TaxID=3156611 RepID=UPI0032B33CEC